MSYTNTLEQRHEEIIQTLSKISDTLRTSTTHSEFIMTSIVKKSFPMPARKALTNKGTAKYDFASLVADSDDAIILTEVVNVHKAVSRLTSAVVSFRKRTGCADKFPVRPFKQEDGTDAVGVWRVTPKAKAVEPSAAV